MERVRWWFVLIGLGLGCGVRFAACEPKRPVEYLPVKLWSCNAVEKDCEVYARFKTTMDCGLFRQFLNAECDPAAPPGEIRCRQTTLEIYRTQWFSECSKGDLTYAEVRDGGAWVR